MGDNTFGSARQPVGLLPLSLLHRMTYGLDFGRAECKGLHQGQQ